jgi:FtsP/CotA-like multicopper oxidase with cupredoxin domain
LDHALCYAEVERPALIAFHNVPETGKLWGLVMKVAALGLGCIVSLATCFGGQPLLAATPKLCTTRPETTVRTLPADLEKAWDAARKDEECAVYQEPKIKVGGKPQRHLFVYLPAGFDPKVVVPNGSIPGDPPLPGPVYAFATDAFGTLKPDPAGKGNAFTASLVPPVWQLWPGDVLHVRFISCVSFAPLSPGHSHSISYPQDGATVSAAGPDACPPGSAPAKPDYYVTNLHTHGLIATPRNALLGSAAGGRQDGTGDNVFVSIGYGRKFDFQIPIPLGHPTGLYWYHPHIHGVSARQVTGGMAGLIAVGDPVDLLHTPDDTGKGQSDAQLRAIERAESDVRTLILKDTQIVTQHTPEDTSAGPIITGDRLAPVNPGLCADPTQRINAKARDRQGICWLNSTFSSQNGDPNDAATQTTVSGYPVWLFTVNGERYPAFKAPPGKRSFIFRISNQSASVSYDLRMIDDLNTKHAVQFELLTVDGVLAGAPSSGASKVAPAKVDHILLMPAGRAEIRVSVPAAGKAYELVANDVLQDANNQPLGLTTGPGTYATNGGDSWPYVMMARILGKAGEPLRSVALQNEAATQPAPAAKKLSGALSLPPPRPSGCVDSLQLKGIARRIVVLNSIPNNIFQMGYAHGEKSVEFEKIKPGPFPHPLVWHDTQVGGVAYKATDHVCVAYGEEEIWEIRNLTSELHNFHIHQAKFRMATADEIKPMTQDDILSGANTSAAKNPVKCTEQGSAPDAPCWADPNNFMSAPSFNNIWSLNGERVMHDTFPIPPALTHQDGSNPNPLVPGRVFLKLTFTKREQIGRYVYHCHILEHEDGGMMAPIEVLDLNALAERSTSNEDQRPSFADRLFASWKRVAARPSTTDASFDAAAENSICSANSPRAH